MRRGFTYDEEPLLPGTQPKTEPKHQWNLFINEPRKLESGSTAESKLLEHSIKWLKFFTIIVTFFVVLLTAVISKTSLFLMTSQIQRKVTRSYCNKKIDPRYNFSVTLTEEETTIWIWMLIFAYCVPEMGTFIRSLRIIFFKTWEYPSKGESIWLFTIEALPAIGSAMLIFGILPDLDIVKAAMLTNAVCFVPGIIAFFSRNPKTSMSTPKMILDILAILTQATAFIAWPMIENKKTMYLIPVSVIFISVGWCENYISEMSPIEFFSDWAVKKKMFENKTYFMYTIIAPLKCIIFAGTAVVLIYWREGEVGFMFDNFGKAFLKHNLPISQMEHVVDSGTLINYKDVVSIGEVKYIQTSFWTPLSTWTVNILTTYLCYAFSKFACKILIHSYSFALPISLTVPVLISTLTVLSSNWIKDNCCYTSFLPEYLFFNVAPLESIQDLMTRQHYYVFIIWWLSQIWLTMHVWDAADEKLTSTERLFFRPMYDSFLIDQSVAMNRRREHSSLITSAKVDPTEANNVSDEKVTRIYACGTMWHETKEEMLEFLKSIIRMDEDQCAHRIVKNYMGYKLPNYYEFETHILFDDAYVRVSEDDKDPHVNIYVKDLIESVSTAASEVHATNVRIKPPTIFPTPYGGRLEWILPGKTKMVAHLKDKAKIRPKKRWSQVMYMYYLLGFKIMDNDELSPESVSSIAENTYLLALDGDIDFQPQAVHLLVDYMKKNKSLGAACGRIHPIGEGAMAWYQIFEYAVGHWLQKATEHVIGCVLCSPGCFSLFRARALMDDNVMAKYTTVSSEARHYVQYDQGEDRWLCTLLLQRGYRVEYSAASDAYTHCPEGFSEFYNQRRRWMPSTTANILDLLTDYQFIVKINDNISRPYIFYQAVLMIGTVIGPGTIFLMLIGSFVAAFRLDQWSSFMWNAVPILIFVIVCALCNADTQLFIAGVISAIYGLVMMAVLVGIMIQIKDDGWLAPSSLFFFLVAAEFIITALLHPQEFYCLKYGVIYYVTVPSMYMLLVIYSVFNMNNVSWGTRDVTIVPKDPKKEAANKPETPKQPPPSTFSMAYLTQIFSFNNSEKEMLRSIQATLHQLQSKLDQIERNQYLGGSEMLEPRRTMKKDTMIIEGPKASRISMRNSLNPQMRKSHLSNTMDMEDDDDDSIDAPSDDIQENSWFYDSDLVKSEVDYLDKKEEKFWNDVIDKYLAPIDDGDKKEKIAKDLKDLRDKMVMTFFMINSLFVLVVFMLTLQKDTIHVEWPIAPKINFTYNLDQNEYLVQKTHLQLEPIGFVFLVFFAFLMGIQFFAMIYHRFGTYCQIMANTFLNWTLCSKENVDNLTEEQILKKDPIALFKKLIRLQGINDDDDDGGERDKPVTRRNTAHFLALKKEKPQRSVIEDLEEAFAARMDKIKKGGKDQQVPRKSVVAINKIRASMLRQRTSQLGGGPAMSQGPSHRTFAMDQPGYEEENS